MRRHRRLLLAGGLAILLAFGAWSISVVVEVAALRAQIEQMVSLRGQLDEARRRIADGEAERAMLAPELRTELDGAALDPELGPLAVSARSALEVQRATDDEASRTAAVHALDALVLAVRRRTGGVSVALGGYWDALNTLVTVSLLSSALLLVVLVKLQKTHAAREAHQRAVEEAMLRHTDRLVSLGSLAAVMAHEINNPMTAVLMNLDSLREHVVAYDGETREILEECTEGVRKVSAIVRDLRGFAAPDEGELTAVDVKEAVDTALRMVGPRLLAACVVVKDYHAVPPVRAVSRRLEQVFLNLFLNAIHALGAGADEAMMRITIDTSVGGEVCVHIDDSGAGIDESVLERGFAPFVTTKPAGEGTGLGLYVCQGIVSGLGGSLSLARRAEGGTRATVRLPPGCIT